MRRFLTRAPDAFGQGFNHFAGLFPGNAWLTNPGGPSFYPHGPKNFTITYWVRVDVLPAVAAKFFVLGRSTNAAAEVLGMDVLNNGHVRAYASNGAAYTTIDPVFIATPGVWYYVRVEYAGNSFNAAPVDQPTGTDGAGGSIAFVGPYNSPANQQFSVGSDPDGSFPLTGAIDSFAVWNDVNVGDFNNFFAGNSPSEAELFRKPPGIKGVTPGRAPNYGEIAGLADAPPVSKHQLYLDFNTVGLDSSPARNNFTQAGAGVITKIKGAGWA